MDDSGFVLVVGSGLQAGVADAFDAGEAVLLCKVEAFFMRGVGHGHGEGDVF